MSIIGSFFVYSILRPMILFGLRVGPIMRSLDVQTGESVLDAGCGFGVLVKRFAHCDYTGIDNDPYRISRAKRTFGENLHRRFLLADICSTGLPSKNFDKVLGYGILHHLPDQSARNCLRELSRLARARLVFADPVYSKYHILNNFLCRHDEGSYVRYPEEYLALSRSVSLTLGGSFFWARSGVAKYFLMSGSPVYEADSASAARETVDFKRDTA